MKISIAKKLAGVFIAGGTAIFTMAPITAFAQVPEVTEQTCICETKCDEDHINQECPVCAYDYTYCEGEAAKADEEEEVKEEPMGPLTPDGNLELVDDYGSLECGGKQFITVVTKAGNYFYIIIDRDDNGTENVHFLNMVDESDLLALMDEEAVEEYMNKTGVGEKDGQTIEEEPVETEKTTEEKPVEEKPVKKNNSGMIILVLVVLGGGAGAYFYFTKGKKKKPVNDGIDPDADYNEDEDDYLDSIPEEDDDEDIDIEDVDDIEEDEDEE